MHALKFIVIPPKIYLYKVPSISQTDLLTINKNYSSKPDRRNKCQKTVRSSEEQSGSLPNIHQGCSNYRIIDSIVLAERKTDQGKSVFHGPAFNMESWSRAEQSL